VHFGLGLGGLLIPGTATAGALFAGAVVASPGWKRDLRLQGAFYKVDTKGSSTTTGGMVMVNENWWWGVYGLGFGAGLGYASAERFRGTTGTVSLAPYLMPVQLAFGRSPRVEVGLTAGVIRFFSIEEFSPWGYVSLGLVL